ncbi:MAG: hypothetical protein AAF799_01400 [Myxococcota bacterium]
MKRSAALQLRFSCTEDWATFQGGPDKRHCERCSKHVHDLTMLRKSEAEALFRDPPPEGLCVRYRHDGAGRILFRSDRYPGRFAWKRFRRPSPT